MGAPLAASVTMRPRYAGVGKLRRSDEAYFQAYLSLWARRIDTTAHIYTYAAYLEIRRCKCFVNPGLYLLCHAVLWDSLGGHKRYIYISKLPVGPHQTKTRAAFGPWAGLWTCLH